MYNLTAACLTLSQWMLTFQYVFHLCVNKYFIAIPAFVSSVSVVLKYSWLVKIDTQSWNTLYVQLINYMSLPQTETYTCRYS